ncbi:hypothetical protein [Variovorax guangxiensis]|nr:hypothetical protein [Variovorax guangxiensis]
MLDDFDALAAAELADIAAYRRHREPIAASQPALVPDARGPAHRALDWVIGLGVLGLVILAARK